MSKIKILLNYTKFKFRTNFKNRDDFEKWQHKKVVEFIKRILPQSSFYQNYFKNLPIEQWQSFPTIDKSIMMENFNSLNTVGANKEEVFKIAFSGEESRDFSKLYKDIIVGLSSGTSGNRGIFLISKTESDFWSGAILAKTLPNFITKKQKIAFFFRANSRLYENVKSNTLEFHYFDLLDSIKSNIEKLAALQPTIIIAPPSMLIEIAKMCGDNKLNIKPNKIISVAEVLDPLDEKYLRNQFNQTIHQVYQCTEGFLGVSCKYGTIHLNEDIVAIQKEYLDEEKTKFMPIITDFSRTSQPIIRYKLNDILTEKKTPCPCGSIFTALDFIEGRMDDIFVLQGLKNEEILIFPDFIRRAVIMSHNEIKSYQVIQSKKNIINIYLDCPQNLFREICQNIENNLKKIFTKMQSQNPKLEFFSYIPQKESGVKLKRIIKSFK